MIEGEVDSREADTLGERAQRGIPDSAVLDVDLIVRSGDKHSRIVRVHRERRLILLVRAEGSDRAAHRDPGIPAVGRQRGVGRGNEGNHTKRPNP